MSLTGTDKAIASAQATRLKKNLDSDIDAFRKAKVAAERRVVAAEAALRRAEAASAAAAAILHQKLRSSR
jgi:hypothetical protein